MRHVRLLVVMFLSLAVLLSLIACNGRRIPNPKPDRNPPRNPDGPGDTPRDPPNHVYGTTQFGLHAAFRKDLLDQVGVNLVRTIITDDQIKGGSSGRGEPEFLTKMKEMHGQGIDIIVTLRWPELGDPESKYDRVPIGDDRRRSLDLLRRFLNEAGPYMAWFSLQNEVVTGGPGLYHDKDKTYTQKYDGSPAVDWFRALARECIAARESNPRLSHLKFSSPALTSASTMEVATGGRRNAVNAAFIEEIIDFSNEYMDALDIHLHVDSEHDCHTIVEYLVARSRVPLTTTEWSQARVAEDWLRQPVSDRSLASYGSTNGEVIQNAYKNRMSGSEWNRLIATAPLTETFIEDSYAYFVDCKFVHACYAGGYQSGKPQFDWKAVWASKTVASRGSQYTPNDRILRQLQALARDIRRK